MSEAIKRARPAHPILDVMQTRWSPYGFSPETIDRADLRAILEAARWSPSSYNEQPWRFLVTLREEGEAWERALECLVEFNRGWAQHAGALALGVVARRFAGRDADNPAAEHDLGLATAHMMLEANARGIATHAMIGIEAARVREVYDLPEGFEPLTAVALGRAGEPPEFPEKLRDRDAAVRERMELHEFVYGGRFGDAAAWLAD